MKTIIRRVAYLFSFTAALISSLLFLRLRAPLGFVLLGVKLLSNAFAPLLALLGWAGAVLGMLSGAPAAVAAGLFGMLAGLGFTRQALAKDEFGLVDAFGADWPERIAPEIRARLLPTRHGPIPRSASYDPKPFLERDVVYHTLPTGRKLLCDIWSPPAGHKHSGLAVIYAHGSAWTLFDKDFGTRPLFRHLANQGHVIIDIAYRLYPEVQIPEMLHDVQRAIVFTRLNAARLGIDPRKLVLGGASAGGHLSLLAAYAPHHPALLAPELRRLVLADGPAANPDLSVQAVFSYYGPCDLAACYTHTNQHSLPIANGQPAAHPNRPGSIQAEHAHNSHSPVHDLAWVMNELGKAQGAGNLANLLGCRPEAAPELYQLYSPIAHIHAGCPPTLLVQGADDIITPLAATRALEARLRALHVPLVSRVFAQTEHGFDLLAPEISPTSLSALYDLERFLALVG